MGRTSIQIGLFHPNRPWLPVRSTAQGTHLAVDPDQSVVDAESRQRFGKAINSDPFRDSIEIERDCGTLRHGSLAEREGFDSRHVARQHRRAD